MNKEHIIKCFSNEQIKEARVAIFGDSKGATIDFCLDDLLFSKCADNYYAALQEVRKELEVRNIKLLCKGCCRTVQPSRMSLEMGGGLLAYNLPMGKEAEDKKVYIFDDCTLEEYATIEEQLNYIDEWYEKLLEIRSVK